MYMVRMTETSDETANVRVYKGTVPTIFAKISGVPDGNLNKYWDSVRDKLSPLTILSVKSPTYKRLDQSAARTFDPYHDGHNIFTEKLKSSRLNQYGFLSDELQRLIFEKLQETNDSGFLTFSDSRERIQQILFAGMNLDRNLLRILQKYDFTKDIPKFIVIDAIEDTFSETECVQLVLMSMLGFDVLVYTPTGYRNMETFISPNAFELHQMNEFVYNTAIPRFKIPDKFPQNNKGGLFQNLFKKGRR